MNEHERVVFDLQGYLVKPAVLSEAEVAELREFVLRQKNEPESLRHSADVWRNPHNPRVALFGAYNHINVRHHKPTVPHEVLDGLSPEHRRFFREVYHPQFDRVRG